MLVTILIIIGLLVLNGLFAMTEIAIVSARRLKLQNLADEGDGKAAAALRLQGDSERFLSTVQIGITIVGTLAAVYGGDQLADQIKSWAGGVSWLKQWANVLGFVLVVVPLVLFELIIGELVPKRIALAHPENIARFMAQPMEFLARVCGPLVTGLGLSSGYILRILGLGGRKEEAPTEKEVVALVEQGEQMGVFNHAETAMVENVLGLDQLVIEDLMTPRPKIAFIGLNDSPELVWHKIVVSGHSLFPVYQDSRDNVVGVVSVKSLFANLAAGVTSKIADVMERRPLIVPETQGVMVLMETFKAKRRHFALVADEFGSISGLITLHDVMQAVMGDFPSAHQRLLPEARMRPDKSWLVDGMFALGELEERIEGLHFASAEERDYQTLGGYVLSELGKVPSEGESFNANGWTFEIIDMDRHRIDKVLIIPGGTSAGF